MTNYIAQAVEPLRADAMDRAEKEARKIIAMVYQTLNENDNDLDKVAPSPRGVYDRRKYHEMKGKRNMYQALTRWDTERMGYSKKMNDPTYVYVADDLITKFVADARENASLQYDAFIAKLTAKAGAGVTSADLSGSHVWGYSYLTLTMEDGSESVWKTQQIINVSKLGKLFNQWPTRKVKRAA